MKVTEKSAMLPAFPTKEEAALTVEGLGFDVDDANLWRKKFITLRSSAHNHGTACHLTFKQYMRLAKRAGLESPDEIGNTRGKFQMSRIGDTGLYEWGNCRFLTQQENLSEKKINGGYARQAEAQGKPFKVRSPDGIVHTGRNMREFCRQRGLNQSKLSAVCRGAHSHHYGWTGKYT